MAPWMHRALAGEEVKYEREATRSDGTKTWISVDLRPHYDEPFAGLDPITLNVICKLIRTLNDALGATSVIVTYDVHEAVRLANHLYLLNDGVIVAHGPTQEMVASDDPFVHQFLHAEPDGPVRFHFPAPPLADDLAVPPMQA